MLCLCVARSLGSSFPPMCHWCCALECLLVAGPLLHDPKLSCLQAVPAGALDELEETALGVHARAMEALDDVVTAFMKVRAWCMLGARLLRHVRGTLGACLCVFDARLMRVNPRELIP